MRCWPVLMESGRRRWTGTVRRSGLSKAVSSPAVICPRDKTVTAVFRKAHPTQHTHMKYAQDRSTLFSSNSTWSVTHTSCSQRNFLCHFPLKV
uniref:Uncharacterized protein n=1 Tax=Anguilla anguilla TaxID=7936 RepID=A0A0E9XGT0_ANGAN